MQDIDLGAAEVHVDECTTEPKCYDHPRNPNIKFWDLPGISNPIYYSDLDMYCKNVPLDKYDTFLIITKDRLTNDGLKLAERIRSIGKKVFFIRARIDQDVENARRRKQQYFDKDATLDKMQKRLSQSLIKRGLLEDEKETFFNKQPFS